MRTRDGHLEVTGGAAPIAVETEDGEVLVESKGPLTAKSVGGDVSVQLLGPGWEQDAEIETVTGDVRVALRRDAQARVAVETRGRIATDFSIEIEPADPAGKHGALTLGDGAGSVRVRSYQGEVTLAEEPMVEAPPASAH